MRNVKCVCLLVVILVGAGVGFVGALCDCCFPGIGAVVAPPEAERAPAICCSVAEHLPAFQAIITAEEHTISKLGEFIEASSVSNPAVCKPLATHEMIPAGESPPAIPLVLRC